jgi:hypothetical protein
MSVEIYRFSDKTLAELAIRMMELDEALKAFKSGSSTAQVEMDYLRKVAIPAKFETSCPGATSVKLDGIGTLSVVGDLYVNVPADNREAVKEWLGDNGYGDLIQETVNASSLKALVKECILNGIEIPDGLINITPFQQARLTKSR